MTPTMEVAAYAALVVIVLLGLWVVLLLSMLDTTHVPLHAVWRWVWCPRHERTTMVQFTERVQTGMAFRTVRNCPLRCEGERCGEGCLWEPTLSP